MFSRLSKLRQFGFVAVFLFGLFFLGGSRPAKADSPLVIRSVDVMKLTKDALNNQPSDAQIDGIVTTIVNNIHPTHIAISVPLDDTSDFSQRWVDAIHRHGVSVIYRGTWEGIEGIYGVKQQVGPNRFPAGSLQSAANDGMASWLGKTYKYIIDHPSLFAVGDIWAALPERTEGVFQDSTSFLSYSAPGIQANYTSFFNDLKKVSDLAFARIGKDIATGFTANNFSEVASTWLPQSVFDTAGITVVDYYGTTHSPQEMDQSIRQIYALRGKKIFLQEWGDYWNLSLTTAERAAYLNSMYAVFQNLVNDNILTGFSYWGAWDNSQEGILNDLGSAKYSIKDRGLVLGSFYTANTPPVAPPPDTTPPVAVISSPASSATVAGAAVSVNANASDDVGLAGVQFKLDGNNLGPEDITSPYSATWDTSTVPNGSHVLTAVARDTSNNTVTSATVTVTVNNFVPLTCAPINTNSFYGCYYSDKTLSNLALTRTDAAINFNYGAGSPDPTIPTDSFSAQWQGNFTFSAGTYAFTATADDGVRVWVDNNLIIDKWLDEAATTYTASKIMTTGTHLIKVQYYENGGGAVAVMSWALQAIVIPPPPPPPPTPVADITPPVLSVTSPVSGSTAISASVTDNIGVAGVQFQIDGKNVGLEDTVFPYSFVWDTTSLPNGPHVLTAIARDTSNNRTTSSSVSITVTNPLSLTCNTVNTNSFYACYYNSKTIGTNLSLTRTDNTINFDWGTGSPDPLISPNNFSVQWQGNFTFNVGTYTFTATTDDGMRVWVDNNLIIDKWIDQGRTVYNSAQTLTAGTHLVKVQYYENTVGAVAKMTWNQNGVTPGLPSTGGIGSDGNGLFRDGRLILDHGIIYVIEYGIKHPILSMKVFNSLGYKLSNVIVADISAVPAGGGIFTAAGRHLRGTLVVDAGTVYFMGQDQRYAFPSPQIFFSWDNAFKDLVNASTYDRAVAIGPMVNQNKVLGASFTPLPFGTFVKGTDNTVYLIVHNGHIYPFTSERLFKDYGFTLGEIQNISDLELSNYIFDSP